MGFKKLTLDSNTQSINCCTSFVEIVSPTEAEILTYNSEKTKEFYNLFTCAIIPITVKYSGVIRKFVGEGLESYFPQSSNPSNVNAMRDVLECCLELIERQKSLSLEMNRKGLSDISYKVG